MHRYGETCERVTHTLGRVTRPPTGHEFRKRSLARGKGSKKRSPRIYDTMRTVAHRGTRERERNKGGFLFASRIAEINVGIYIHIPRSNAGANDREKLRLERGDHREATAIKYCRERSARTSWLSPGFFCSTTPKETFFQTEDRFKYPLIRYSSRPRKEWEIRRARMAPLKASERGWLEEVRRERREGREKRRIREGVDESHLAIPFVSVLPRPAFLAALSDALLRRPTTRLHRYKRDIQPRDLLFRTVSHNG